MQQPPLHIHLLGSPEISWRGAPVQLARRQMRALLFRLAVDMQPVTRDSLLLLLWPDTDETTARRNLTRLLSALRHALPDPNILEATSTAVSINPLFAWSDTVTFTDLTDSDELPYWEQALTLYRDLFLSGFFLPSSNEFNAWQSQQQHYYEHRFLGTLAKIVAAKRQIGKVDEAITLAQRYLLIDELSEEMHCQLIKLYGQIGDRGAALRQFEQCALVLERELGVTPLPKTRAVYEAVRKGELVAGTIKEPKLVWATLPSLDIPLIGRETAWETLNTAYGRLRQGGVIFISGEAGVGKSRLMQEFASSCTGLVLSGNNEANEQTIPYQPLIQALRQGLHLPSQWTHALSIWLAELSRLMPDLAVHFPDLPAPVAVEPQQAQARMFEAFHQVFASLAVNSPLLLCLDNIHWTDESTRGWLQYMSSHLAESGICILATYRAHQQAMVAEWQAAIERVGLMFDLTLDRMAETAVEQILNEVSEGTAVAKGWAALIHQATGGNTFFVLETVRELLETDRLSAPPVDLPLPQTVRDAVLRRISRLSPLAQQILEVTAVLASSASFALINEVAGREEMETANSLEELFVHQLLQADGEHFRFQHELAQETIYKNISKWRRRLLHQRAAGTLEKRTRKTIADFIIIAHHFEQADNREKAAEYLLYAGEHALNMHAFDEAIEFYQQALHHFQQAENNLHTASTLIKLSLCYQVQFKFELAQTALAESFRYHDKSLQNWIQKPKPPPQPLRLATRRPVSLDPTLANDFGSSRIIDQLFSGLVQLGADNVILPAVARTWEILDGGRTYVFHLRQDARWIDGQPVTAHDFLFAWQRSLRLSKRSPLGMVFIDVKDSAEQGRSENKTELPSGIYAPNSRQIVIELNDPNSNFLYYFVKTFSYPIPQHIVSKLGDRWAEPEHLVTNGPYSIDHNHSKRFLRLAPSSDFYDELVGNTAFVDVLWLESWQERLEKYEAGELDVLSLWGLPPQEMKRVRRKYAADYVTSPWFQNTYVVLNMKCPPFADVRVRQAMVMALNRNHLSIAAKNGFDTPATGGFIPPGMFAHSANIGLAFNPQKARELLAEAGYANGEGFPIINGIIFSAYSPLQNYLSQQWSEHLHVNVQWETLDWVGFQKKIRQGSQDLVFTGWVADYPDPDNILRLATSTDRSGWRHPQFDELIAAARNLPSNDERENLYKSADKIIIDDVGVIPISYGRRHKLIKPWIKKFPSSPLKDYFWRDILIEKPSV